MLVVMRSQAAAKEVEGVVAAVVARGLTPHVLAVAGRTAIGITGDTGTVDTAQFAMLPGVEDALRVTKPFKLASREMKRDDTTIAAGLATIGPKTFTVIAGPCSAENETMLMQTAEFLRSQGLTLMRAGAFKPRTSPYSFQGLGLDGLKLLNRVREKTGIGIVTEVMDVEHAAAVEDAADVLQIGARNMQNYSLLKRVGQCRKPVLLKRGPSATLNEWLMSAEYILAGGNYEVILCERGVRTFNDHSRNTLDLGVIPPAKTATHLPILVDPSHGSGKRAYVPAMSRAALAAGADGLLIEVHPDPDRAVSDGAQSLDFQAFTALLASLRQFAPIVGRTL